MKGRFLIYALVFVVVILTIIFWHRPNPSRAKIESPKEIIHTTNQLVSHEDIVNQNVFTNTPAQTTLQSNQNPAVANSARIAEGTEEFVEKRNKLIDFYCRFIDQDGNPVSGVKVTFGVERLVALDPAQMEIVAKYSNPERTTDADGRIEIHGEIGNGIGIGMVTKDGFLLSPKAPRGFGGSSGSYENPLVFKMWKEGAKEPLIGGNHVFGIDSGKTYTLNLVAGKKIEGISEGDLLVSITRPSGVKPRDKFQWSFTLEAKRGGFTDPDPDDEFMYVAPRSGYLPKIEMQFDPSNPDWTPVINKTFFFFSREGQVYGRAKIEIDSIYNVHSAIQIDYTLNPNGSRYLQP